MGSPSASAGVRPESAPPGAPCENAPTRARLLENAMRVIAERGMGGDVIPHGIAAAGLSSEAPHAHDRTSEALLLAVAGEFSNELIALIEQTAGVFVDPAKRIACGVRMYLRAVRDWPLFASFVLQAGLHLRGPGSLLHDHLPGHIAAGERTARFADAGSETATDLIAGTTLAAAARIAGGSAPDGYPEQVAVTILKGLGVPAAQARRLSRIELPRVQPAAGSLLARARPPG